MWRMLARQCLLCLGLIASPASAQDKIPTALIVAVDVSGSVDEQRYRLQMEGLAEALVDPDVVTAITDGGGILFMMIAWADQAKVVVDWRRISTKEDAVATANVVRKLPLVSGNFTCLGQLFRHVSGIILPDIPSRVAHTVLDVSGDGIDNCMNPDLLREEREQVLKSGTTINGLPIIEHGVNDTVNVGAFRAPGFGFPQMSSDPGNDQTTLDRWYRDHVVGGPGSFVLVAQGYGDFKRALRQKFVTEISSLVLPRSDR